MIKRYFLIIVLVLIFCLNFTICGIAETQVTEEKNLNSDLKIYSERIGFVEVIENPKCKIRRNLKKSEYLINTENPNVNAVLGYKDNGSYWLKIYDKEGNLISEFQPQSDKILIPKNKDIIWVAGQTVSEGFPPSHRYHNVGLYQYDFSGKLLYTIDKETIGKVRHLNILDNGDLICFAKGLTKINNNGEILWTIPIKADILKVFGDGEYICTEYAGGDKREIQILNSNGKLTKTFTDNRYSHIAIAGTSNNLKYFVIKKFISPYPAKYRLFIYDSTDWQNVKKEIILVGGVLKVLVSDDLGILVFLVNEKAGKSWKQVIKVIDINGNIMAEYISKKKINEYECDLKFDKNIIEIKTPEKIILLEILK